MHTIDRRRWSSKEGLAGDQNGGIEEHRKEEKERRRRGIWRMQSKSLAKITKVGYSMQVVHEMLSSYRINYRKKRWSIQPCDWGLGQSNSKTSSAESNLLYSKLALYYLTCFRWLVYSAANIPGFSSQHPKMLICTSIYVLIKKKLQSRGIIIWNVQVWCLCTCRRNIISFLKCDGGYM